MDYMKANSIEFSMKINRFYLDKSILNFNFDTKWEEWYEMGRDNRFMIYWVILIQPLISIVV